MVKFRALRTETPSWRSAAQLDQPNSSNLLAAIGRRLIGTHAKRGGFRLIAGYFVEAAPTNARLAP